MKAYIGLIQLHLLRWLRRPTFLLTLLLPLLLMVTIGLLLPKTVEETLFVGIYLEADSELAQAFWGELEEIQTPPVSFVQAESREQLEQMVAATQWECGYILPENFDERLESGDLKGLFIRIISPSTHMQMLSNSAISAALLSLTTEEIAASFLEDNHILSREEFDQMVADGTLKTAPFSVDFDIETTRETVQASRAAPVSDILRGILSISLFLFFALAVVSLWQDLHSEFFSRLAPLTGRRAILLSGPIALLLVSIVSALTMLLAGMSVDPALLLHPVREFAVLLLYLLYLTALSYTAASFLKHGSIVLALLPFLLLASVILSPIFLDIPRYLPALHPVSCLFPATLYFRACEGQPWAVGLLAFGTLLLICLGNLQSRHLKL